MHKSLPACKIRTGERHTLQQPRRKLFKKDVLVIPSSERVNAPSQFRAQSLPEKNTCSEGMELNSEKDSFGVALNHSLESTVSSLFSQGRPDTSHKLIDHSPMIRSMLCDRWDYSLASQERTPALKKCLPQKNEFS